MFQSLHAFLSPSRIMLLVLNGLLYLGVSVAQRDYLQIVLSRTFCPRNLELGEEEDVVGVDEVS